MEERGASIAIRTLGLADAPAYRALRLAGLQAFPHAFRSDYQQALAQPLSWTEKRLAKDGETWFGAFEGGVLVGALCLRMQDGPKVRHTATLNALVVDPEHQRRGIGHALVAHLVAHARALGFVRQITLTVTDGNTAACSLYEGFGFSQFGLEPDVLLYQGRFYAKQHRQLIL